MEREFFREQEIYSSSFTCLQSIWLGCLENKAKTKTQRRIPPAEISLLRSADVSNAKKIATLDKRRK